MTKRKQEAPGLSLSLIQEPAVPWLLRNQESQDKNQQERAWVLPGL